MSQGPVCHIPPKNVAVTPEPKPIPGLPGPISPGPDQVAFNNNVAALLNALRLLLLQLANQAPNDQGFQRVPGPKEPGRWVETNRVVQKVRVFQNNDTTSPNWVDVEQINGLTMRDSKTGAQWRWNRG